MLYAIFASLDLGFTMVLCPPWACACWSLGPLARVVTSGPLMALFGCNHLWKHIPVMPICSMHTLSPLCMMICLPCLLVPPVWLSLLFYIIACLPTCPCMSLCLLVSSSLIPTFSCGLTTIFDTQEPKSLLRILLDGIYVIHNPIKWNYGHSIQTYICPPRMLSFVW